MSQYPHGEGARSSVGAAPTAMPVTTTFEFPEWHVERYVGSCFGLIVRSMGALKSFGAAFKAIAGGEVTQYTELLEDSRRHAIDRMIENARIMGGNAIVGMRFDSSEMGESLTEIVAYGTAVVVVPKDVIGLVVLGVIAVIAVVGWTRLHRHGESPAAAPGWQPTPESFRDPSTGRLMRVWIDPADGTRHYVPEPSP